MKTHLDFSPCLITPPLQATLMAGKDAAIQKEDLTYVMDLLKTMDMSVPPPLQAQVIHSFIREFTGLKDPYESIKIEHNSELLRLEPTFFEHVINSPDPLREALMLAGACNAIDMGPNRSWKRAEELYGQLMEPLLGRFDLEDFKQKVLSAKTMLYIADNAGEIVGDKILLSILKKHTDMNIIFVVRGGPVLNDATFKDATMVGIDKMVHVISTGSDCPGVVISDCSREFKEAFDNANLILAKGQGNYETLNQEKKEVFFLLQIKCPLVGRDLQSTEGEILLTSIT